MMTSLPPNAFPPAAPGAHSDNDAANGNATDSLQSAQTPYTATPPAAPQTPAGYGNQPPQAPAASAGPAFPPAPAPAPPANGAYPQAPANGMAPAPAAPAPAAPGAYQRTPGAAPFPPAHGPAGAPAPMAPPQGGAHKPAKQPFSVQRLLPVTPFEILTYAGALLVIVSCAMPFITVNMFFVSNSYNLFQGVEGTGADGWIFLVLALAAAALAVFKLHLVSMIVSAVTALLAIYEVGNATHELQKAAGTSLLGSSMSDMIKLDSGAYLLILSALAMLAGSIVSFVLQQKAKKTGIPVKGFGGTGAAALNPGGAHSPAPAQSPFGAPVPGAGAPVPPANGFAPAPGAPAPQHPFGAGAPPAPTNQPVPPFGAPVPPAANGASAPGVPAPGLSFPSHDAAPADAHAAAPAPEPIVPADNPYVGSYTPSVPGVQAPAPEAAYGPADDDDDDMDSTVLSSTPRAVPGPVLPTLGGSADSAPSPAATPAPAPYTSAATPSTAPAATDDGDDDFDSTVLSSTPHSPRQ